MSELIEGWAVVKTVSYEHQAELISDQLQSAGIENTVFSQKDSVNTVWVGDLSEIKILVPHDKLQDALDVCKDIELPDMELSEDADVGESEEDEDRDENEE
ncbi:MAG TPA: hypothetical protein PLG25_15785 [bacterium]|nr:hypothetical protein [bacterium]HMW35684.1 hypothetical protein [bacterium]HMY37649.1 hypothetical protein [bacterium]HMZ04491.1 hypothetical protein [bacterium]HNB08991.1 hypothetical protein [bacterium]